MPAAAPFRYKAFISYSHADEAAARWLHRGLENYRAPKQLGLETRLRPIFRDRDELAASTDLSEEILAALEASESLIVICSRSAAASHWVNQEVLTFQNLNQSKRIYCLLLDGEPNSSDNECLPQALRLVEGAEPLAADLRRGGDGRRGALLKIAAGLLGVRFDKLRQRDHLARQRRLAAVAAFSFAGMIGAVALAWFALVSRQQAVQAQEEAEAQRLVAEQESRVARQTTQFMVDLFHASDPSEARGNTITAREILDQGLEEIRAQEDLDPVVRGRLLLTMGRVYQELGLYTQANLTLDASLDIYRELGKGNPFELAEALVEVGTLQSEQGDFDTSRASFIEVLTIYRQHLQPPHEEIVDSLIRVANTHWRQDRLDEAEQLAEEAQAMFDQLPEQPEDLKHVLLNLKSNVYAYQGRSEEAEPLLREMLDYSHREYGELYPGTGFAHDNLAITLEDLNKLEEAEYHYRKTLEILLKVYGPRHPEIAQSMGNLGAFLLATEQYEESEAMLLGAIERFSESLGREYFMAADAMTNLAELALVKGNHGEARSRVDEAIEIYGATMPPQHENTRGARLLRADILIAEGALQEAEQYLQSLLDQLDATQYPDHARDLRETLQTVRGKSDAAAATDAR